MAQVHGDGGAYVGGYWVPLEQCSKKFNIKGGSDESAVPAVRSRTAHSAAKADGTYDVAIIGAGCIGAAIARELSKTHASVVVLEAADGAHSNIALEATEGGLYRPQAAPPGVRVVATGAADALADCGVLILDTSRLGPAARARRVVRRLALETTAQQDSIGNRLHCELIRLRAALDEMGWRTAQALDVPLCQGLDLILAVGAAAADVDDGRMTLEAVRRACAAAPRSAAASRQDRASRRRVDPSAWFELALRGQAPPFAAAGDDTIEVANPRLLAAIVALKRGVELLAGPKGSYASSRWQKRSFRLPQLYAFEAAASEARGKYLDALAAVENSA